MDKKQSIIEAAAEIVVNEGMKSLTLSRLAREVGITTPGLLYHFANMEEVMAALVAWCDERYLHNYLKQIKDVAPYPGRTPEIYMKTVVETYGDGTSKPDIVAAALYASTTKAALVGTTYAVSYDRLKSDCFDDGGDVGEALSLIVAFDALSLGSALAYRFNPYERSLMWEALQRRVQAMKGKAS